MRRIGIFALIAVVAIALMPADIQAKRLKTGVIEKLKNEEGEKYEVFTDTVYHWSLTSPDHWEFKVQKEESDERNPHRLHMKRKDKQIPTQLWESQGIVTPAQIDWFIMDIPLEVDFIRDSLRSSNFEGEWQKPLLKACDLLYDSEFLPSYDVTWGKWRGAGFSAERSYQAQIPSGAGLYNSVTEKLLADFYVFPYGEHKLIIYLVTEREFLQENRDLLQSLLNQIAQ